MLLQSIIRGVLRETAADDGGGAGAPAQEVPQPSMHERLKSFLFAGEAKQEGAEGAEQEGEAQAEAPRQQSQQQPQTKPQQAPQQQAEPEAEPADDFTTVTELAERTGLGLDRILDLAVPAKVDGKEAKATIREMLKSYQLDSVLNTKMQTHAAEVEAWKVQQQQEQQKYQQNLQRLDAGLQVAQRRLQGRFASVDWQALQADPAQYAQTYLSFQQEQAELDQIAQQLGQERSQQQKQQQAEHQKWLAEQKTLLEAKLPGWGEAPKREAAIKEMVEVLGKEVGFTAEDFGKLTDHRDFIVADMATKWLKLQKSKPAVLNQVRKAAPMLKPGSVQSTGQKQSEAFSAHKGALRKSGSVQDFAKAFRAWEGR